MRAEPNGSAATVTCAAIDLGASSCRVFLAQTDGDRISLRERVRFETPLVRDASGYQCWDVDAIEAQLRDGLGAAQEAALASVGVDSWAVDFVLLDDAGRQTAPAVSYRDPRTQRAMADVLARMPASEVYRRTGIPAPAVQHALPARGHRGPRAGVDRARPPAAPAARLLPLPAVRRGGQRVHQRRYFTRAINTRTRLPRRHSSLAASSSAPMRSNLPS